MICSQLVQKAAGQPSRNIKGGTQERKTCVAEIRRGGVRGKTDRELTDMFWWERGPPKICRSGCVAP